MDDRDDGPTERDEVDAHLARLADRFDAPPATDLAERAAARARRSRMGRTVAAAATLVLVVGLGAIAVRAGTVDQAEVVSGPPPGTVGTEPEPRTVLVIPPVPATMGPGDVALVSGRSGDLDWTIVRSPGEPPSGTCWRLDGPALDPGRPSRCGFDVPQRALGVEIEHTAEAALVWGPVTDEVSSVRLRLAGGVTRDAEVVDAVDGSRRFYVALAPNGVVIDEVGAYAADGTALDSVAVGSAPCPCPPTTDPPGSTTGDVLQKARPDGTWMIIPMNCPDRDGMLCIPSRADQSLLLEEADLAHLPPSERDAARTAHIALLQSYWASERFPTASDDAGNPTAWATLDELADP